MLHQHGTEALDPAALAAETEDDDAIDAAETENAAPKANAPAPAAPSSLTKISMRTGAKRRKSIEPVEEQEHDLLSYWEKLCEGRTLPSIRQLDEKRMSFYWPNAVLYQCVRHGWLKTLDVKPTKVFTRTGSEGAPAGWTSSDGEVDESDPMVSRQACLARKIAKTAKPTTFEGVIKTADGIGLSKGTVLPFSNNGKKVDHVLFYIGPAA